RSGRYAIWACRSNASDCLPLSPMELHSATPTRSPDDKRTASAAWREASKGSGVVSPERANPRARTKGQSAWGGVERPGWSQNGQWIYSHCGPRMQVCRIPSTGGDPEPVRGAEGVFAEESPDREWLYYSTGSRSTALKRIPVSGGEPSEVLPEVGGGNWTVTKNGIWYATPWASEGNLLRFYDFASRTSRNVYRASRPINYGVTVSPDRRRVLFSQVERTAGSDIMLVENFR